MTNAQHTPGPSDVMAYFDLSDEQWDILPNSVVDRLTEIYMKETAAPAMYEALQAMLDGILFTRGASMSEDRWQTLTTIARTALAQAEGVSHE